MLFTGWINTFLQCTKWSWTNFCSNRALATTLLVAGLVLNACTASQEDQSTEDGETLQAITERSAIVTSMFAQSDTARSLAFLPNSQTPWTGLLVASLEDGGFDIFNIDGMKLISTKGPKLNGLAVETEYALRGESLPILFGVDEAGTLRGFAALLAAEDVVELPLEGDLPDQLLGVCHYRTGIGFVDIAVLTNRSTAKILRVKDAGGAGLQITQNAEFSLPIRAEYCAEDDGSLIASTPISGLVRVNTQGQVEALLDELGLTEIALTRFRGQPYVLLTSPSGALVRVLNAQTLELTNTIKFNSGINTTAFEKPISLTISDANFGGMAYSSGLFAVYDDEDKRIKIIAREVLSRALFSSESEIN